MAQPELQRVLGKKELIIIGFSGAVGTGVLFSTAGMTAVAGPGVVIAWLIGALLYLSVGLTYIDLSFLYPEEGGPSRYSLYTFGPVTNMINAISDLLWYVFLPPIEALGAVMGLNYFYPHLANHSGNPTILGAVIGVLFMLLFFPLNYFGIRTFSKSTKWIGVLKLILYFGIAIGFISDADFSNFYQFGGVLPFGIVGLFKAIPLAMFCFGGLRVIPDFTEEVKDQNVIIPSILWSLLGQSILYLLFGIAMLLALNWNAIHIAAGNWGELSKIAGNPFIVIANSLNVSWLIISVLAISIIGPFVAGYIYLGAGTRVLFAMGRSKIVSRRMIELSKNHNIPVKALIVITIIGIMVAFVSAPLPSIYKLISDAVVAGYIGFSVNPAIMIVLRKEGRKGRFASDRLTLMIAVLAFASASLIIYWSGWPSVPYASTLVLLLALVFGVTGKVKEGLVNSIWYIAYIVFLSGMTYIGSVGAQDYVSVLMGSVIVVIISLLIFLPWSVASCMEESKRPKFTHPSGSINSPLGAKQSHTNHISLHITP
ncbi:APC family permease [Acidithiobacillus thiooxidans]|uniref:APC family permease n=1 Tax=Acidithiobacillus thiooxidans TaxID=930 RepID=UPI001C076992|nr:APC family permease [Acidithiobacillus thiooxidans]MBU2750749.1 APC family permease [Acidithiobacillus thiooxidans]